MKGSSYIIIHSIKVFGLFLECIRVVKLAISKLNINKAKGVDEIPSEMIKYSGD